MSDTVYLKKDIAAHKPFENHSNLIFGLTFAAAAVYISPVSKVSVVLNPRTSGGSQKHIGTRRAPMSCGYTSRQSG